jgi:hypothetical protein
MKKRAAKKPTPRARGGSRSNKNSPPAAPDLRRDLGDAEAMIRLHLTRINLEEVEASIREFSTLLEDSAPLDAWREVKRRTRLT